MFIVAIIVFGLTLVLSSLVMFKYGTSENQSLRTKQRSTNNAHRRNASLYRHRWIALAAAARMVMRGLARAVFV